MPPKSKRQPNLSQLHLKHSRQLLEDYLYQYLPLLTGLGALSRINIFVWFNGKWGLTPDASGGLPFMMLEALRSHRQHLLNQKLTLKPLRLSLLGDPEDTAISKALGLLEEINRQLPTATLKSCLQPWPDQLKQLQAQLLQQPHSERNLLLLDPLGLNLPPLQELLQRLPKRLDVVMLLPEASVVAAAGFVQKQAPAEAMLQLASLLPKLEASGQKQTEVRPESGPEKLRELKAALTAGSRHFGMRYPLEVESTPLCMLAFTHDALMMEKTLLARQQLSRREEKQLYTGAQLGLFGTVAETLHYNSSRQALEELLASREEWSNQELYQAMLQEEILPKEAENLLQELIATGSLLVLDEKKKKIKGSMPVSVNHTAYKLPAPSRYFKWVVPS